MLRNYLSMSTVKLYWNKLRTDLHDLKQTTRYTIYNPLKIFNLHQLRRGLHVVELDIKWQKHPIINK